jgi:prophage antirepressor-like protein
MTVTRVFLKEERAMELLITGTTVSYFQGHPLRILMNGSDSSSKDYLWFVLSDVAEKLRYDRTESAGRLLKDYETIMLTKSTINIKTHNSCFDILELFPGKIARVSLINEKGLYRLIFNSRHTEAEVFQDWVFGEVLPEIRRTGAFIPENALIDAGIRELLPHIEHVDNRDVHITGNNNFKRFISEDIPQRKGRKAKASDYANAFATTSRQYTSHNPKYWRESANDFNVKSASGHDATWKLSPVAGNGLILYRHFLSKYFPDNAAYTIAKFFEQPIRVICAENRGIPLESISPSYKKLLENKKKKSSKRKKNTPRT